MLGLLLCTKFREVLGECIPSPALEAQGQASDSPREGTEPAQNPSLTPELILPPPIERTFSMRPLLPKMSPQCPGFILKGSGLCDHHSSLPRSPPTRGHRFLLSSWALWLYWPGTEAGRQEATGPLETPGAELKGS